MPNEHPANSAKEIPPGTRISTEFLKLTERYFAELGIPVKVVWSYGATEAKVPEIVDAIVDITETGNTLRAHGMKIIETLLSSEPVLIANRDALEDEPKRAAMDDVRTLLLGALRAEGRVPIKLNVGEDRLQAVLAVVPSMKAPDGLALSEGGYAIETVVDKRREPLIPDLKAAGPPTSSSCRSRRSCPEVPVKFNGAASFDSANASHSPPARGVHRRARAPRDRSPGNPR